MKSLFFLTTFLISLSASANNYYVPSDRSSPELEIEHTVYMGDRMLNQKYAYSEQCFSPRGKVTLEKELEVKFKSLKTYCLTATKSVEKECCGGGRITIRKGGTLCGIDKINLRPMDFESYHFADGRTYSPTSTYNGFKFKPGRKGKMTVSMGSEKIKMSAEEFDATFSETTPRETYSHLVPWNLSLAFSDAQRMCISINNKDSGQLAKRSELYSPAVLKSFEIMRNKGTRFERDIPEITATLKRFDQDKEVLNIYIRKTETDATITATHDLTEAEGNLSHEENAALILESDNEGKMVIRRDVDVGETKWNLSQEEFAKIFEETANTVEVASSLQRSIEYAGIQGNLVKFIYSEFSGGVARDAYTREFTIDLTSGNVGAYKGAVFEVIKATNSTITYKVVRNFPSGA